MIGKFIRSEHQHLVDRFMWLAGQTVPLVPTEPMLGVRILRAKLILEEALETIAALGVQVDAANGAGLLNIDKLTYSLQGEINMVEVVDGCCDIAVVTTGTLSAIGVSGYTMQSLVDLNNLEKFGPGGHRREDGKWMKPLDHKPPDIYKELVKQGWSP